MRAVSLPSPAQIAHRAKLQAQLNSAAKLRIAKQIGKRRLNSKWQREHFDEFDRVKARERQRAKAGTPIEGPLRRQSTTP